MTITFVVSAQKIRARPVSRNMPVFVLDQIAEISAETSICPDTYQKLGRFCPFSCGILGQV